VADPTRLVGNFRVQADACRELGSPLYDSLLRRVADDIESGGPAAVVLAGHEDDPGPAATALRLMGGVHRLVLQGRAPELARHYPSVGGDGDAAAAWSPLRDLLADHREELRGLLHQAPQTNEVGRAAALIGGLQHVLAWRQLPVRLAEMGASGGLNLRADRFRVDLGDGDGVGPEGSPVVLRDAWAGAPPPLGGRLEIVERLGCDTAPVDPTTTEGRLRLTSYVWPDQVERLARLRGALEVAAGVPAEVAEEGAASFVRRLGPVDGTVTVLWHSVMWQYLGPAEQAAVSSTIEDLGGRASDDAAFAHLFLEPRRRSPGSRHEFLVVLRRWPGGEGRVIGSAHPHGIPTTWDQVYSGGA
jgi:hypothetical protein